MDIADDREPKRVTDETHGPAPTEPATYDDGSADEQASPIPPVEPASDDE